MRYRGWKLWMFARRAGGQYERWPADLIAAVDSLPPGASADMRHARRQQRTDEVSAIEECAIKAALFRKRAVRP